MKAEEKMHSQSKEIGALRKQVHDYDGKLQDQKDLIEKQEKRIKAFEQILDDNNFINAIRTTLTNEEARRYWRTVLNKNPNR